MLQVYTANRGGLQKAEPALDTALPADCIWLDLATPTFEEIQRVEEFLGLEVPSREEMQEIEISSRIYQEDGALFLTSMVLAHADTEQPELTPVTFILSGDRLATLRYAEPRPFAAFALRAQRPASGYHRGQLILTGLLEAIIDRAADILERVVGDIDLVSRDVFRKGTNYSKDFQRVLETIGRKGDLVSKIRESQVGIGRLITFLLQASMSGKWPREVRNRLKTVSRDVQSLTDHATFLSNKIAFLLDATLGMINIEQNAIIKIFSVAAVVFLPPTLIASIYGMNFKVMPELSWPFGYPFAVGLMILSALLPYWYFKRRGWL